MTRIIFSLKREDKQWLEATANSLSISMAEVLRRAIQEYRQILQEQNTQGNLPVDNTLVERNESIKR